MYVQTRAGKSRLVNCKGKTAIQVSERSSRLELASASGINYMTGTHIIASRAGIMNDSGRYW